MVYLQCPKCGNSSDTLFVDDIEFRLKDKRKFKAICCPQCGPIFPFEDYKEPLDELLSKVNDLESELDDLSSTVDSLNSLIRNMQIEEPTDITPY